MTEGLRKTPTPFTFDQSFDDLSSPEDIEVAKKKEEEEAAPTFSEEELQAAREEAYQQGQQAGLQEAMTGIEQQTSTTLEVVSMTLARIDEQQKAANELIARDTIDLAIAAVRKLLPELSERDSAAEVETFLSEIMSRILEEPKLTIRVADSVAPDIETRIQDLCSRMGFGGTIDLTADSSLGPADCRIRWSEGDAERIVDATLREIEALTGALPRPTTAPLELSPEPIETPVEAEAELPADAPIEAMPETLPELAAEPPAPGDEFPGGEPPVGETPASEAEVLAPDAQLPDMPAVDGAPMPDPQPDEIPDVPVDAPEDALADDTLPAPEPA